MVRIQGDIRACLVSEHACEETNCCTATSMLASYNIHYQFEDIASAVHSFRSIAGSAQLRHRMLAIILFRVFICSFQVSQPLKIAAKKRERTEEKNASVAAERRQSWRLTRKLAGSSNLIDLFSCEHQATLPSPIQKKVRHASTRGLLRKLC